MSWLHEILNKLTTQELEKLENFRLKGKEKQVYNYIYKARKKKLPSANDVCKIIEISTTHYYKINSILLEKLFEHLFSKNRLQLLNWLKNNSHFSLLKTELKNICNGKHFEDIALNNSSFFLACFHLCIDLPFVEYDIKLSKMLGELYLKSLTNSTDADLNYVKYHILFADCNRISASRNPNKNFQFDVNVSTKELESLLSKEHYLAYYYLCRTFVSYYSYVEINPQRALEFLEKAIKIQDEVAYFYPINIRQFLRLNYADLLINNNQIKDAFLEYTAIFNEGISNEMYGFYYHVEQYIIASLCTKNYIIAEELLEKYFNKLLNGSDTINNLRGLLCNAKLRLSLNDIKATQQLINLARGIIDKTSYLPFDLQLRVIENVCFLYKKDYEFTKQLAYRNIKFIEGLPSKKMYEKNTIFFKMISAIANSRSKEKKPMLTTINTIKSLEDVFSPVYGNLINHILAESIN